MNLLRGRFIGHAKGFGFVAPEVEGMDDREEKLGYKIREAQMQKIPYMLVIGDKEVEEGSVNIRRYGSKDSETVSFDEFLTNIKAEITK